MAVNAVEKFRIRISEKNRKMGAVPSVSLPPVKSCARDIPCARVCYVVCNMLRGRYGATIARSYAANLAFLLADADAFFGQLSQYLQRRKPEYFRFHVSGDFISPDHMRRAFDVARAFPGVRFLAFSKRLEWFPRASTVPRNFSLIASLWPNWGERPPGYRVAFMQDGTETRAPANALHCPGGCDVCGLCWNLRGLRRDVVFPKH